MLKSEVFEKALQEVVAQTEISRERILSRKHVSKWSTPGIS